jgi:hypothetical protein
MNLFKVMLLCFNEDCKAIWICCIFFIKRFVFEKEDEFSMENGNEKDLSVPKAAFD